MAIYIDEIISKNIQKMYDKYQDDFLDNYEGDPCYRGEPNEVREEVLDECYESFKEDFDFTDFCERLEGDERFEAYITKFKDNF